MRAVKLQTLPSLVGTEIGTSDWWEITPARIEQFAQATGDFQWIHVDEQRAKHTKFGSTIAHGLLILSMLPGKRFQTFEVTDTAMTINYGLNKVRFLTPVPSGSRTRAKFELISATERPDGGLQCTFVATVELENAPKPACVAEMILIYYHA